MARFESVPYRPCAGLAVFNRDGLVFIGRRIDGSEHVDETHAWQVPQGGIDPGEDPWPAALRELYEETNIRSIERLGEIEEWLTYDIPCEIVGRAWARPDRASFEASRGISVLLMGFSCSARPAATLRHSPWLCSECSSR